MPRIIVQPHQLDLDSPGRRDYWVALEHDSIWGDHLMPLSVWVGPEAKEGQGLVAFGSNHGNEYEGPVALKHLLREIDIKNVRGRIILVPVLNASAFRSGTRESVDDDGVNLNRAFVDNAGKIPSLRGITHRIAQFVRDYIWPRVHVVIDLHAGGRVARFAKCASYHEINNPELAKEVESTARWFGTPYITSYQNQTVGLLPSEAEELGKLTIGTELGFGCATHEDGVRFARQGVLAAAIHQNQLAGNIEPIAHHADGTQRKCAMVDRSCFTIAPFDGHFEPIVPVGTIVKEGQLVGFLHDFDHIDEPGLELRAPIAGVNLVQAWEAPVRRGQHILVHAALLD